MTKGVWEQVGHFNDLDLASAVFRNRSYRQKLVHAVYEDDAMVSQDVIAEVGRTRETEDEAENGNGQKKPSKSVFSSLMGKKLKVKIKK